jgi:gamma-tubulin complex component 2
MTVIYQYLLEKTIEPYMEMLNGWLYEGKVVDCYEEFMISENTDLAIKNQEDLYWEKRFSINSD